MECVTLNGMGGMTPMPNAMPNPEPSRKSLRKEKEANVIVPHGTRE